MSAPFRIRRPSAITKTSTGGKVNQQIRDYFDRLIRMIPAEVIGLYMVFSGFIPAEYPWVLVVWSVLCLIGVFLIRIWGTADPDANLPPQGVPVGIAAGAFVIWLYYIGGPFAAYDIHLPWVGSLAVGFWSFVIPIFYKGD